ncbi:MAG: endonuclease NucS domain-containing protein [Dehalococcoidia bacterium]
MGIEVGIWRIDQGLTRLVSSPLNREKKLEEALSQDIDMLDSDIMLIGRQVVTADGKLIDLLASDIDGNLQVIELKRDKTPREAVAQLLDYGYWVQDVSHEHITTIFKSFSPATPFEQAFEIRFGAPPPEILNESHQLILVASELDASSEHIVQYTARWGVPINVVFFRHFQDGDRSYIARTWLREPMAAEALSKVAAAKEEPWNGTDFGVTLGEGPHRNWEDCRPYGFVSGGQGIWYSRTLKQLFPGARVFVSIPGKGYVGVGTVTEAAVPVKEFTVELDGTRKPILELSHIAPKMDEHADDPNMGEYLVKVEWVQTRPVTAACWKPGMRANQNTAFKLRSKFTLEQLVEHFGLGE